MTAKLPTPEDPTPEFRTTGRLPDNRPHWMMVPSHERYVEAKRLDTRLTRRCNCGDEHEVDVFADGTTYCERTDSFTVAGSDLPQLLEIRRAFERETLERIRSCELF